MKKILILFLSLFYSSLLLAQSSMIVNDSIKIGTISRQEAIQLFLTTKKRWNGIKIVVILIDLNKKASRDFFNNTLKYSIEKYKHELSCLVAKGRITEPIIIRTSRDALVKLSQTIGGIGYNNDNFIEFYRINLGKLKKAYIASNGVVNLKDKNIYELSNLYEITN